jgi:exodeoxyribonuclease-3
MKIATFNCNSVRQRIPIITYWLQKENPHILALQEIKVTTEEFPREPFEELGYRCEVRGRKGYAGVATISRQPAEEVHAGFRDGDEAEESRILACRWGRLHVINTYCPQGRDPESEVFQYKLEWFRRLREMFDKHYEKRQWVVWLGDFNVAPERIDVYDSKKLMGHVCHRPEVFEALAHVHDWGFIDLFRKFHPNEAEQYSFWDYRVINSFKRKMGWRVDHIFVTNSLAKKATRCEIDPGPRTMEKPSDHTFVYAEFDF